MNRKIAIVTGVSRLSKDLGIPQTRTSQIIKGKRRTTADTALRLSKYFGTTVKFWLGLPNDYDIEEEMKTLGVTLDQIPVLNDEKRHGI